MTKKTDTWMPLLVDKYLGDTTHLTTEQHGAYLLLLMAMWKRDGSLPADDAQLAQITRLTAARWRASRAVLLAFFTPSDDGSTLTQKRLSEELLRSKATTAAKAQAGAKGAAKKWGKGGEANGGSDGEKDGTAIAMPSRSQWQTGAYTPTPSPTETPRASAEVLPPPIARALDPDPPDPEPDPSQQPTPRGAACIAIRRAGIAAVNPSHPDLQRLLDAGVTPQDLADTAAELVGKGKGSFPLLLATVDGRLRDASAAGSAPSAAVLRKPTSTSATPSAEETRAMLDSAVQTAEEKAAAAEARRRVMSAFRSKEGHA